MKYYVFQIKYTLLPKQNKKICFPIDYSKTKIKAL